MSAQEPYRLGSLGDLVELLVDGWEITQMHYSENCGGLDVPDGGAAAQAEGCQPRFGLGRGSATSHCM